VLASAPAETDDTDAYRAGSGFRRHEEGPHTSSGVLTFVEVSKVDVESALHAFYPCLKGIRRSANFMQNIVSKYLTSDNPYYVNQPAVNLPAASPQL